MTLPPEPYHRPERVVKECANVTVIEIFTHHMDGTSELAGYYVYGGKGDSSILHLTLDAAETEFRRRLTEAG